MCAEVAWEMSGLVRIADISRAPGDARIQVRSGNCLSSVGPRAMLSLELLLGLAP